MQPDVVTNPIGDAFGEGIGILIGLLITVGVIILIMKLPNPKGPYISSRSSGFGIAGMLLGGIAGGLGGGFSGGGGLYGGGGATGSW